MFNELTIEERAEEYKEIAKIAEEHYCLEVKTIKQGRVVVAIFSYDGSADEKFIENFKKAVRQTKGFRVTENLVRHWSKTSTGRLELNYGIALFVWLWEVLDLETGEKL